jgi:small subunit ribosomal protein S9
MATKSDTKFIETIGRRKTATARVRLTPGNRTSVTINGKDVNDYFATDKLRMIALEAFLKAAITTQFAATVVVNGGGINGQAEAVRHAISRALVEYDANLRTPLKREGFLKRDPRAKERRKPGFKKARKRPQWSKR